MAKTTLLVCTRCDGGSELHRAVKKERKRTGARELFKVREARCLDLCDAPCTAQLEGKRRSTVARQALHVGDAAKLVEAARSFAALAPGEELGESMLPGVHAD